MQKIKNLFYVFLIAFLLASPVFVTAQVVGSDGSGGGTCVGSDGSGGGSGDGGGGASQGTKINNPLNGVCSLYGLVVTVLEDVILPIGAIVIVIFIIYTGFLFVVARGNEEKLKDAKKSLLYVLIGSVILLGAVAISEIVKSTIEQLI